MTETALYEQFNERLGELTQRLDDQARAFEPVPAELAKIGERLDNIAGDTRANGKELQGLRQDLQGTRDDLHKLMIQFMGGIVFALTAAVISLIVALFK
jgi:septation ring formation regulator EzrA